MILTKPLAWVVPTSGLRQAARRAGVYRVNRAKCIVRPVVEPFSRAEPGDQRHGRPTARHDHQPSAALEFTNVNTFANIIRSFGSLALPNEFPRLRRDDDEDDYEK
jgi:hypothetical protein